MTHWRTAPIILCMACLITSLNAYSGGTGTAEDPYQIATAEALIALGNDPNDYDKHFILTADIDLSAHTFNQAVIAPDTDPLRSGFQGRHFTGVFHGDNRVIQSLQIKGDLALGLFGYVSPDALICDLSLEDISVHGTEYYIGGLVAHNEGALVNCCATAW